MDVLETVRSSITDVAGMFPVVAIIVGCIFLGGGAIFYVMRSERDYLRGWIDRMRRKDD